MDTGLPISRYQLVATVADNVLSWSLHLETDDGARHELTLRDAEEVPLLTDMFRNDRTVYYDAAGGIIRTGWNYPGGTAKQA